MTPIPTSTSTPEDPLARLGIIGVDALSVLDAGTVDKNNSNILIPNGPKEYLLGMKVTADTNTDDMKMVLGGKDVLPTAVLTREDGSKEAYFSITRGTKELTLKSADRNEGDVSQLLPQQEPENVFKKMGDHISVTGKEITITRAFYGVKSFTMKGPEEGYLYNSIYFPKDRVNNTIVVINFSFTSPFYATNEEQLAMNRKLADSFVLVAKDNVNLQGKPNSDKKRSFCYLWRKIE